MKYVLCEWFLAFMFAIPVWVTGAVFMKYAIKLIKAFMIAYK